MSPKVANVLYGVFVVVCLVALVWPGYALFGNRIEPTVFGVPFSLAWNVLWIAASFVALLAYHTARGTDA